MVYLKEYLLSTKSLSDALADIICINFVFILEKCYSYVRIWLGGPHDLPHAQSNAAIPYTWGHIMASIWLAVMGRDDAEGVKAWQRRDPWLLLSCLPGASAKENCFVINTDTPLPVQLTKHQGQPGLGNSYPTPSKGQPFKPRGRRRRLNQFCSHFYKARAGCLYREECIFVHRYLVCKREDHGRCTCPTRGQESEKPDDT